MTLDAVCMGVAYVQVWVERKSDCSSPSFRTRLQAFVCDWPRRAGWPRLDRYERGMHDRDVFSSVLIENSAMIRPAGLEMPEQISRVGRRGDMSKKMMSKATKDTHVSGRESKDTILGECLSSYRAKACESFVRWDLDERARRAASTKATPAVGPPSRWHSVVLQKTTSRRTRIEMECQIKIDRFREGQKQPAELLVFHYTQTKGSAPLATEAQTQRGFIEERTSLADDETKRTVNAEKRKVDETAKELRAPLPITTSSRASSSRPDDEIYKQLTRSSKQARITKTRAEAAQDVSFLFLQAWVADMRGGNEERMMMMKEDQRTFYFAYCPPEMQTVSQETRRTTWETQMSLNAVVNFLTDEKTPQLTNASRETCPLQRVDTDKKAHFPGDDDYVCVPARHESRLVGCGDFETTEGLRADPPAGDVDSHNIFCSWCAQAHVSIH